MSTTVLVPLTQGKVAIIDAEDEDRILAHKWSTSRSRHNSTWYARTTIRIDGKPRRVSMHRVLMGAKDGEEVDHINGNGLDNRRSENLRVCTRPLNARNQRLSVRNKSGYKGVSFRKRFGDWQAVIVVNRHKYRLGYFDTAEDAAKAYDAAARRLHEEFANLNLPDSTDPLAKRTPKLRLDNKSGYVGVSYVTRQRKWKASVSRDGKRFHIGHFDSAESARDARLKYIEATNDRSVLRT